MSKKIDFEKAERNILELQRMTAECKAASKKGMEALERIFIYQIESGQVNVELTGLPTGVVLA